MTPEQSQYFDSLFTLFASKGWETFVETLEEERFNLNNIVATSDEKDLYFRKGKILVIDSILNYRSNIEEAYNNATSDI